MKLRLIALVGFIFLVFGFVIAIRLRSGSTKKCSSKINVLCTTSMITDVVKAIGGEWICVKGLMGPGVDPHLYRARESDVRALTHADIIFYNGLHLEGKMTDIFSKMRSKVKTVAVTDIIKQDQLINSQFDGIYDPHIWHDVQLWIAVSEYIKDVLSLVDPMHKNYYKKRALSYIKQLHDLNSYVEEQVKKIPQKQRIMVTAHDAFSYFGRTYDVTVIGLQGINTDSEVSTKDIQNLVEYIVDHKIPAIFVESSIPQRNIQAVQKAVRARGWQVEIGPELFSDALGDYSSAAGTYIGMIRHNIDALVSVLAK
ncbi:MAG: zinc ABC transporter substrate-binding protein [Candidatus Babeliales bacterium]